MNQTAQVVTLILGILNIVTILSVGAQFFNKITKRLDRIEYALYNDGKTGLVQEQQAQTKTINAMKIDLEVMKAKYSI